MKDIRIFVTQSMLCLPPTVRKHAVLIVLYNGNATTSVASGVKKSPIDTVAAGSRGN
jgi:hypothetical protein